MFWIVSILIIITLLDWCMCRMASMASRSEEAPECVTCEHIFDCTVLRSNGACINYKERNYGSDEMERKEV